MSSDDDDSESLILRVDPGQSEPVVVGLAETLCSKGLWLCSKIIPTPELAYQGQNDFEVRRFALRVSDVEPHVTERFNVLFWTSEFFEMVSI